MNKIRTAVIGVGYLGRFHAQKFAALEESELVAVVDSDPARAREMGQELNVEHLSDYQALAGRVDAVSIVVPTTLHYEVARFFLEAGVHVLVEKPITSTVAQANELVALARKNGRVLQVGHLERFNAAMQALGQVMGQPLFIESHRLAPFKPRGTDVSVVLDLMIHDIDIIQNLVGAPIEQIDANGAPVLSDEIDIANARIRFANGCVANVTASRVSAQTERKMRIFQHHNYVSIDFQNRVLKTHAKGEREMHPGIPEILIEEWAYEPNDALMVQAADFLRVIREGGRPKVSGEDGRDALKTADKISQQLNKNLPELLQ